MWWAPLNAGRRPLALFDQFAAIGIIGVLGACSVGSQGIDLWMPGFLGLASGLTSYLIGNRLLLRFGPPQRSVSAVGVVALAFLGCGAATGSAWRVGAWLVQQA